MKKSFILLSIILTLGFSASSIYADEIALGADSYCPMNCNPGDAKPGFMIEIAQKSFAPAGHTIKYEILPWARAIKLARIGKINGVIAAFVEDTPDFVFPKNETGIARTAFFTLKKSNWKYQGVSSLSKVRLGIINDYSYGDTLDAYIKQNKDSKKVQSLGGDSALETNIKKLIRKRIDAITEVDAVFMYTASKLGLKDKVKFAGNLSTDKSYISFSPAIKKSKEYARILSDGIQRLRDSGELKKILAKYGLEDWK